MSKNAKSQIHVGKTKKRKKFEWWVEWRLYKLEQEYALNRAKNYVGNGDIKYGYPGTYWLSRFA